MKKAVVYLCAGILSLGLTACGGNAQGDDGSRNTQQTDSSDNQQDSQSGSESAPQGTDSADDGQQDDGGQGGEDALEGWSQEMEGLRAAVADALGENYWPDMAVDSETLEILFGITPDMYEDYMGEMPMMSAHVDKLVIVKAKEDKVGEVQAALEAYRDAQVSDTMQYPMNLGKIQASRVETVGNYVIFTMLGGDDSVVEENGEEAKIVFCQEANDLAINTIKKELGQ